MRRNLLAVLLAVTLVFASVSTQAGFTGPLTVGLSRALTYGLSQIEDADGFVGYLLNALGFATSGEQTLTAPDPVLALDWDGVLTDFGGAVNADGVAVAPTPGSRLVTTVADGAVILDISLPLDDTAYTEVLSVVNRTTTSFEADSGVGGLRLIDSMLFGATVSFSLEGFVAPAGSYVSFTGTDLATTTYYPSDSGTTITFTVTDASNVVYFRAGGTGTFSFTSQALDQTTPTVLDTDTSSNPLHPSVTTGGVTDYVFYPAHEVSTAYASDKFVWAEASDGSTRYYSSSGGTSAASAPTFPTSGTVVDNDITWTYEGRYGLSGQRVEGAATNLALQSQNILPSLIWVAGGSPTIDTDVATAPDGTLTADSIKQNTDLNEYISQTVTLGNSAATAQSWYVKNIDATQTRLRVWAAGELSVLLIDWTGSVPSTNSSTNATSILYDDVGDGWYRISYIFTSHATETDHQFRLYPHFEDTNAYGTYVWQTDLVAADFVSSPIATEASTVTRSAVNLTIPTSETGLTAAEGAINLYMTPAADSADIGSNRVLGIGATGNPSIRNVSGLRFYGDTTLAVSGYLLKEGVQAQVQTYWDGTDIAIRARDVGGTWTAWASATDTMTLHSAISIGKGNDNSWHINAAFDSTKFYPNAAAAAADLDDWSLNSIWGYDTDDFGRLIPADADVIYGQAYAEAA